jgi:phospholipid/cholesterol/gamma-HCH transport system substrate-binding protein
MKPVVRDTLTGLIVVIGIAGLIGILFVTGELTSITQRRYSFTLALDNAGGMTDTSIVTFQGVRVGKVKAVRNSEDPTQGVLVELEVGQSHKIPRIVNVDLNQTFVGDVAMELTLPPGATLQQASAYIDPGETLEFRKANTMFSRLGDTVKGPMEKLVAAAEGVRDFSGEYTKFGQRLNELVAPRTPEDVASGKEANVTTLLARADRVLASANNWIGDDALRGDVRSTIASAKAAAENIKGLTDRAGKSLDSIDAATATVQAQLTDVGTSAKITLKSIEDAANDVRSISAAINRGEGTAGQLIKNPDLYNNLNSSAQRLEKALEEFRLLAEKYRKEGLPIKF